MTPKGMDLLKDAFEDVNVREFRLNMQEDMASPLYNITVSKTQMVQGSSWGCSQRFPSNDPISEPAPAEYLQRKGSHANIWW
jgi:hypothetical protein